MNNSSVILKNMDIELKINEPLCERTTFKVGGKASLFAIPKNKNELRLLFIEAKRQNLQTFILGGGSNIVVADKGIDKLVISTEKLNSISFVKNEQWGTFYLYCEAGCSIKQISEFCILNSFEGFENFSGLPGSIGGASFMNARCYNISLSDIVYTVEYLDSNFEFSTYSFCEKDWGYKKSPFQKMIAEGTCLAITSVCIKLKTGNSKQIEQRCKEFISDRENKGHFKFYSAGSFFKNNHDFGKPTGKIIEESGLRGLQVGGARVADWHGNFIINTGNATESDIRELAYQIQKKVKKDTGFSLECEVIFTDDQ
ncbi:MAG: UDP-N-acetylmuramate dehydrogenase [Treponemataceae bacterium]